MIDGDILWDKSLTQDMVQKQLSDSGTVSTFPDLPASLYDALKRTACAYPDKIALADHYGRQYTYRQLDGLCLELAAYLYRKKGVRAGGHVGLMMYNCVEFCVSFLALSLLGAVAVPLPTKFREGEVISLAERADAGLIICDEQFEGWFSPLYEEQRILVVRDIDNQYGFEGIYQEWERKKTDIMALQECQGKESVQSQSLGAPAIIMFTSGTTSKSKGVLLKNYNIMHAVEAYRRTLCISNEDVSVIATPIYHITGLVALLGLFIYTGGLLYLHRFFDAKRVIKEAREKSYTFIHASPTVFNLLIQEGENTPDIPTLRCFACGSSNMTKDKLLRLHKWLPESKFHTVYGLTETSSPATVFPEDAAGSPYIGSSGIPIPGTQFKIVDEDKNELPPETVGEIAIRGSVVFDGYYGKASGGLEDGWLYTGDLGYFKEEAYLYVVDRKKNMINRGGEKIWCFDVENELTSMEGVEDAAVVGIPDDLYGEVAAAAVQLASGSFLTPDSIREHLKCRMAKYKVPVRIRILDGIPQTVNGKTDKVRIRQLLMEEEL